jgi:hypothetical protein
MPQSPENCIESRCFCQHLLEDAEEQCKFLERHKLHHAFQPQGPACRSLFLQGSFCRVPATRRQYPTRDYFGEALIVRRSCLTWKVCPPDSQRSSREPSRTSEPQPDSQLTIPEYLVHRQNSSVQIFASPQNDAHPTQPHVTLPRHPTHSRHTSTPLAVPSTHLA